MFEGRADVTQQVGEVVTDWGRLRWTRIKHFFSRSEMKKGEEKIIK